MNEDKPMNEEEIDVGRRSLVKKSTKDSSAKTYASSTRSIQRALTALRGGKKSDRGTHIKIVTITKNEFTQMLCRMQKQKIGCSNGYAAALKKAAAMESTILPWLTDPDMKAMIKAVAKSAKRGRKPGIQTIIPCQNLCQPSCMKSSNISDSGLRAHFLSSVRRSIKSFATLFQNGPRPSNGPRS